MTTKMALARPLHALTLPLFFSPYYTHQVLSTQEADRCRYTDKGPVRVRLFSCFIFGEGKEPIKATCATDRLWVGVVIHFVVHIA